MKILLIGDIHGNIEALDAVLTKEVDKIGNVIVLGDIVGYMANPKEAIDSVKDFDCILGNHDYAMCNTEMIWWFNSVARQALTWTKKQLREEDFTFLKGLPFQRIYKNENFTVVHGCLGDDPFEYLLDIYQAEKNFKLMSTDLLFVGHTHVPIIWQEDSLENIKEFTTIDYDKEILLDEHLKYIFNIGSVGQPRDGDSRSCYVIYDTEKYSVCYRRQEYDINKTVRKIAENNLPRFLYERLTLGV